MRTKTIHYFKEWNNEVTGGVAYFKDVISSLYNYKLVGIDATHHFEKFKLLQRATKIKINQNLFSGAFILNYTPVTLLNRKKLNDSIAIFHHYDESLFFNNKKIYRQFYKNYFVNLKYVKKIVVVSNYWKEWLQTNYNIQNVEVIYNSLDTEKITNIAYKTEFQELKKKNE